MQERISSQWVTDPKSAHREWRTSLLLTDRTYADQSQRLYISLFGRFCSWLEDQKLTILNIQEADLIRFLKTLLGRMGSQASNRTKRTYLAEITRVMSHLQDLGLLRDNPALHHLDNSFRQSTPLRIKNVAILSMSTREIYLESLAKKDSEIKAQEDVQSCAINFLLLDCGFTLKEIQKLSLEHASLVEHGRIHVPGHRNLAAREVPLTFEAQLWLTRWLKLRKELYITTLDEYSKVKTLYRRGFPLPSSSTYGGEKSVQRVFVTFLGKPGRSFGLRESGMALGYVRDFVIYKSARKVVLAGNSMPSEECEHGFTKGPQALRLLCMTKLFLSGKTYEQIMKFMGLSTTNQIHEIIRALNGRLPQSRRAISI